MKIRFNKFEKVAGLFVLVAILSCVVGMVGIAVKNGWFSSKIHYHTELESADGIHAGTAVQIAGLRVGAVTDVELRSDHKVLVKFEILEKFKYKVRKDSQVNIFRPFILADKILEVSVGTEDSPEMESGANLTTIASTDLMDLLSGKKMTAALGTFDKLADSLKIMGEAFADPERTQSLVRIFDRMGPLVDNLELMSLEVGKLASAANKNQRVDIILGNLATITKALEKAAPHFAKEVPDIGTQLGQIVRNMNVLTTEFQKLTPAIGAIAPDLPRTTRRAVEALDETVVLLKAMQRSFLLRGKVDEVRKEEGHRPANTSEP